MVVKQCALGHQLVIVLLKDLRVLLVIVHAENISCHMIVAARIDARTGRVKCFRCSVNDVECVVKLFPAVGIPCLVVRTPADNSRVVKIAADLFRPLRQNAVNGIGIGGIETPVREFAPNDVA